jgi:hypothetical protein
MVILAISMACDSLAAEAKKKEPEESPSVEMLEFLGEWQTREGDWFDPTETEPPQEPKLEQRQKRKEQGHE